MPQKIQGYNQYIITQNKFLEKIHATRFKLSQKLEKMSPNQQVEYFKKARQKRKEKS